ncbi:MAG: septation protein SpoVG family protein [Candidatus Omnitrophota bacterium]
MDKKELIKIDRIFPFEGNTPTKAFFDLLILDTFIVKGLRIVQGKEGLFVSMPQQKGRDGKWYNTFLTLSKDTHKEVERLALEEYRETNKTPN